MFQDPHNPNPSLVPNNDQETASITPRPKEPNISVFRCCFRRGTDPTPARAVFAEMVGTFLLMMSVCAIAGTSRLEGATGAGLTVAVLTFSVGPVSGAHLNPAVTVAAATAGQFPWSRVPPYAAAQLAGSVMATYAGVLVYGVNPVELTTQPVRGCGSAFWVEFLATFILMFLTASLAYESPSVGHLSGFVIGMAIGLDVLIAGPISGGSMNPARSLGPAIVSWSFNEIWIYITAPIIGAVAGALFYAVLRPSPDCFFHHRV